MEVWQLWGVIGILLIIVEMFTPVLFFLNLAIATIVTGTVSYYISLSGTEQVLIFAAASVILLAFLRPMLLKIKDAPEKTGMDTYLGQKAKVTQKAKEMKYTVILPKNLVLYGGEDITAQIAKDIK